MVPPSASAPTSSRTGFVAALLVGALGLSAVLAYQAVDAGRSHQAVALKTLKEHALFAAWEFSGTARTYIQDKLSKPGLDAVARLGGKGAGAPLRHPAADRGVDFGHWTAAEAAAGAIFRVELGTGAVVIAGPEDPALAAWLRDGLPEHLALALGDRGYEPVMADPGDGVGPIVYRTFPEGETSPTLVYGFRLRPESLAIPLGYAVKTPPLLPEALTKGRTNEELFFVSMADAAGRELWRSATPYRSEFVGHDTVGARFAGFTTTVTINPLVAESLIIGGLPGSRLPLVLGLLLLTVGLVVAALHQLRREAELAQLRSDFVSGVSHELRTPLAQIRMFAETLLLGRVRSDEERTRSLEIIANESRRLTHQVENILLYSRAERDDLRARIEPVDLEALAREVVEAFQPLAERGRCRVDVTVPSGITASADGGLVRQALLNLLDNAVKYGPSGQRIALSAARVGDGRVRLWVEDQGPGVPARDRRRIFEPYYRLAEHRESAVAGSGIGLSVVRRVARELRGDVVVEDGQGGGARFVLTLPEAVAVASARQPVAPRALPASGD